MMKQEKCKLILGFFAIIFSALGSMGGCNDEGGGGGNTPFDRADLVKGGRLYDKWWTVNGAPEPADTNPTYPTEQNAMFKDPPRSGSDTWRCKECHGWDYLGVDGFYGPPSSHFTGVIGVLQVSDLNPPDLGRTEANGDLTPDEIFDIIKFGVPGLMAGYEGKLSDEDIWDLVRFLKEGTTDDRLLVDYNSPDMNEPIPPVDLDNGEEKYNTVCAACHGLAGNQIEFEPEECVGDVAVDNPVEFFNKVRFGQPGSIMPSSIENGWKLSDVKDVLAHAQTFPLKCEGFVPIPTPTPTPTTPPLDGAQLYSDNCAGCHGENAEGNIGPNIQGETAEEIEDAIMNVPIMASQPNLQALTSEEIEAIADFLATF